VVSSAFFASFLYANHSQRNPLRSPFSNWATLLLFFIFAGQLALIPATAFAQCAGICKGNEILVGEDEKNCYCKDRHEYAGCVRDAGKRLGAKLATCEGVLACLRRNEITDEVGLCAAAILTIPLAVAAPPGAVPLAIGGTAITCTWLSNDGIKKARECLKTTPYTCAADTLETHKEDIKDCRE
jgi:hypothetical protein